MCYRLLLFILSFLIPLTECFLCACSNSSLITGRYTRDEALSQAAMNFNWERQKQTILRFLESRYEIPQNHKTIASLCYGCQEGLAT